MTMNETEDVTSVVARNLAAHYERVRLRVHTLVADLSTEQLWRRPFPFGNSVGHLLLHLTGNLSYYIGARIAETGYVRDRPKEFADPSHRPKHDVLRDFDQAVALVLRTLAAQSAEDLGRPFSAVGAEDIKDRFGMFLRCASHADHHAGQMIYLCKQLALPAPAAP